MVSSLYKVIPLFLYKEGWQGEVVKLPDGEIEVIGRKQHIIDIVRERCGDDVAKIISEWIDPEELDIDDFEFDK